MSISDIIAANCMVHEPFNNNNRNTHRNKFFTLNEVLIDGLDIKIGNSQIASNKYSIKNILMEIHFAVKICPLKFKIKTYEIGSTIFFYHDANVEDK